MCIDPVTMAATAAVVATVSQGVSTVAAVRQSRFEGRVAERNAAMDRESARDTMERGRVEEARYQQQLSQRMGSQRAALAANGIDLSFGSAADFLTDTAVIGQEDAAAIRENAMRETRGYEISATNYQGQASAARSRATGQAIGGALSTFSTALGGAQQYKRVEWNRNNRAPGSYNPWG